METLGSKTPVVILSHHNCEIHCCHLDGYKENTTALLNRLSEIEAVFLSKPSCAAFRVWFNVDENHLENQTIKRIAESLSRFQEHIHKIAFIGLGGFGKWKFNYILEQTVGKTGMAKAYFKDAERAKGWLI